MPQVCFKAMHLRESPAQQPLASVVNGHGANQGFGKFRVLLSSQKKEKVTFSKEIFWKDTFDFLPRVINIDITVMSVQV